MLITRITGNQLRAGRAVANLSMEALAARARISRRTLSKWESSSNAMPDAMVSHLRRVTDVLEGEGVRFSDNNGVNLERPAPTVIYSEGTAA
jgi:transcriptional regulator with XRE-family HTH domain